ncbi:putative acetyl-CoA synthetase-like protein [Lyophyllum shimeji]|uniref:Acetyl-CoA synthetase-like protein n=1 Tax=Lyophyllum shimeji TaxID=47721 RepID=A0A9P3PYM1_LYOSH|nr:putative acetyl-CoA synthetase-like protein [Lyophyllum shimeji]
MNVFGSNDDALPHIPDDITLAQFVLEYEHPLKSERGGVPCLIEDSTGRKISFDEVKNNTRALASVLRFTYSIGQNDVVMVSSPNHTEFPVVLWAVLMLGGIVSCSNPQFTVGELVHHLRTVKVTFAIAHSSNITTVLSAALLAGLSSDRVILIDRMTQAEPGIPNVHDLRQAGLRQKLAFQERALGPGEGRRKVALLSWSSGTTGMPKADWLTKARSRANAQIGQAYGLTEMTCTLAMIAGTQKRGPLGSGGRLLPGVRARVVRPDGSSANYGEEGEFVVKGPAAALGYLNHERGTRDTFVDG